MLTEKRGPAFKKVNYGDWSDSKVKQQQRELVMEYILKWHPRRLRMKYFGLPGPRWYTERMLEAEHFSTNFVACENNYGTLERGIPWMPGRKPKFFREEMYNGHIDGCQTDRARVFYFDFIDFMNLGRDTKRNGRHRSRFSQHYKRWTCAWIDSWSPVGSRLYDALIRIDQHLSSDVMQVPIAITFLIGRDNDNNLSGMHEHISDPLERRVEIIRTILKSRQYRSFVLDDAWSYSGHGGSQNMGTVVGRMVLQ